jgi:iron complex outermembrane receptor protein
MKSQLQAGWLMLAALGASSPALAQSATPAMPVAPTQPAPPTAADPAPDAKPAAAPGAARPAAAPAAPGTPAATPPGAAQRVEITGGRQSDTEERRRSTAAKIVIGREEIDKFGDSTLGEVLRRLPGVTTPGPPGRGGPPRLRGLGGGYTQLLIDGQRIPPGFSLESLTPEQVERIEILRAPTAETGARAIAGTINIITREGFRRRLNDLRLGLGIEHGEASPGLNWTHNNSSGNFIYNVSGSAFRGHRRDESTTDTLDESVATGQVVRAQRETAQSDNRRTGLNLTSRLSWRLGEGGDSITLMPNLFASQSEGQRRFALTQSVGTAPPLYDSGDSDTDSGFATGRLNVMWRQRLGAARLELNGGLGGWRSHSDTERREFTAAGGASPVRTLTDTSRTRQNSLNLNTKVSTLLGGRPGGTGHSLVAGAEIDAQRRTESRTTLQNGLPLLNPNWAAHAGLRWEGITTRGDAPDGSARPENRSSVLTPLLHAVYKPNPRGRDQLRMSLTRSYKSPDLGNLIARPTVNSRYPVSGPNTPTAPDRAGNPDLRPELAIGLDVAVERYLEAGGLVSANLFHRRITDLMRSVTSLETVSWSPVPRYVSRTQNIGNAITQGLELEARFRLDQLVKGAAPVELRGNLLTLGSNVNWVPGYRTQLSAEQVTTVSTKRVWDAFGLWTFNPAVGLRVLASNLAPQDFVGTNAIQLDSLRESTRTLNPGSTNWQVRLELKL